MELLKCHTSCSNTESLVDNARHEVTFKKAKRKQLVAEVKPRHAKCPQRHRETSKRFARPALGVIITASLYLSLAAHAHRASYVTALPRFRFVLRVAGTWRAGARHASGLPCLFKKRNEPAAASRNSASLPLTFQ